MNLRNNRGQSLAQLLLLSGIAMGSLLALAKIMSNLSLVERGVASNSEMTALKNEITSALSTPEMCQKSGLIHLSVAPLLANPPLKVPVQITLGTGNVIAGAGIKTPMGTRQVVAFDMISLEDLGASNQYLATLFLTTEPIGKATTFRRSDMQISAVVQLNPATQQIASCGFNLSNSGSMAPTGGAVPAPPNSENFPVAMTELQNYNDLLTNRCDHLVDLSGKITGHYLYFMSACRRYCSGCNTSIANCRGNFAGKGYNTGFASECNGTNNSALCVCVR